MELRQLKYFIQVAESLNFTEASKKLFITQSTISQQIKQLEEELNVLLFDRSEKQISLTEAGNEFLIHAGRVLREAEYGKQRLLDLQNIRTGELFIGVNYSFSSLVTSTVIRFHDLYPNIKLYIIYKTVSELLQTVKKREVDFALSYEPLTNEQNIESKDLFTTPLSVIVHKSHPLSSRENIKLEEIKDYSLALPSKGLHARTVLDSALFAKHLTFRPEIELNEANMLLRLVKMRNWITILAATTVCGQPELKAVPLDEKNCNMQTAFLWVKDSYQKYSAKEFIRMFVEEEAKSSKNCSENK